MPIPFVKKRQKNCELCLWGWGAVDIGLPVREGVFKVMGHKQ